MATLSGSFPLSAGFRSLAGAWADATTPHGRLLDSFLGGTAEFERELSRAHTSEGQERAKKRGVHMGRPPTLTAHQREEALRNLAHMERVQWERRIALMRGDEVDADMLDEEAHALLGRVAKNEVVILTPPAKAAEATQ